MKSLNYEDSSFETGILLLFRKNGNESTIAYYIMYIGKSYQLFVKYRPPVYHCVSEMQNTLKSE